MTTKTETLSPAKGTKKLTSRDLFALKMVEDPRISPDGEKILYTLKTFNAEKDEYDTHIEIAPFNGGASRAFTQGKHDGGPRFSPDGKQIAFVRRTEDRANLFVMPADGGEPKQVTWIKNGVGDFSWSPDGKKIAFTSAITEKGLIPEDEKPEEDYYKKYNADVKVIRRMWYKLDGKGFLHDKRAQVFILDLETEKIQQLTSGEHDASSPRFSPDGKWIAFSSNRNPESDYEPYAFIYIVPAQGGEPKNLTPGEYYFGSPSFSPDGKWIAFTGTDEPANFYSNTRIWLIPAQGGKPECLTRTPDLTAGDHSINDLRAFEHGGEPPVWSADGGKLFFSVTDSGKVYLMSYDLKMKKTERHADGNHVVYGWDYSRSTGRLVAAISDGTNPNDIWTLASASAKPERLTDVNGEFLKTFAIGAPERFEAKSKDGTPLEGWILKPPDFQSGKKYPAVLQIHGGPMAMYSWGFFFEFQLLAGAGYVVAYCNPRGSLGYGQPFCEAIRGDWGNLDYLDVMSFFDAALAEGYIDEKRAGVAGGSYGGYMTNWIVGHTDRFKAAVTMRSVTSEFVMFGTSDFGFLSKHDWGAEPWENPEKYAKISPLTYAANVKTPLLILHSENDLRCPMSQAEMLYAFLKKMKKEVEFVRFPDESHDLSRTGKPWHRIFRLDQIVGWFKKHL